MIEIFCTARPFLRTALIMHARGCQRANSRNIAGASKVCFIGVRLRIHIYPVTFCMKTCSQAAEQKSEPEEHFWPAKRKIFPHNIKLFSWSVLLNLLLEASIFPKFSCNNMNSKFPKYNFSIVCLVRSLSSRAGHTSSKFLAAEQVSKECHQAYLLINL